MSKDRPRRRRWPWIVTGVLVVALLTFGGFLARDGWRLLQASDGLSAHGAAARAALGARDIEALRTETAALTADAHTFRDATSGPHWWIAAHLPWVGDQAVPLMVTGQVVGELADDALGPLAELDDLEALGGPAFEEGRVDPFVLEPYRETLAAAASSLAAQGAALADVDVSRTVDVLRDQFADLEDQVGTLSDLVAGAHTAAELLPTMLGGAGERHYVVVVQNNAEPRATGGIPGAFIELTVDDGRIALGSFVAARDLVEKTGAVDLTEDELRVFTDRLGIYPQDANFTPEFPRTAQIVSQMWTAKTGDVLDGVLSIDPVALGWILEGAPAVTVDGVEIGAETIAPVVLNEAYSRFESPTRQDAFFVSASAALFDQAASGGAVSLAGVERAIDARRFLVWSADEAEQALLETEPISGAFLDEGAVGVFLNDGSGSKMGYYVDTEVAITDLVCASGDVVAQAVGVTVTNTFDGDVASLPAYVSGGGVYVPAGQFQANLLVYPATGMRTTAVSRGGVAEPVAQDQQDGRALTIARVVLDPGESITLTYQLGASEGAVAPPAMVATPGAREAVPTRMEVHTGSC
ncbi:DUF4012 domain-containing protein [Demequina subtropica]|uniref:DUF4012 domain-containing protein n=1 Tax=Demequina subtropica TaxID=1638989 RepID=UPI000784B1F5|nr:DUF4012 domain-containing protein [Demequina subtropica]